MCLCMPFLSIFLSLYYSINHIYPELCVTISFTVGKNICSSNTVFRYCFYFLHFEDIYETTKYEDHKHPNYSLPHHCTLQWEEISFNYCFNRISLFQINSALHRSVFMFVCIYSTIYFCILNNGKWSFEIP